MRHHARRRWPCCHGPGRRLRPRRCVAGFPAGGGGDPLRGGSGWPRGVPRAGVGRDPDATVAAPEALQRGTTHPPGTPRGESSTCQTWIRRARKLAIDAER